MSSRVHIGDAANLPPISALLSQLLIAFTIEFDNEFEQRSPHWTTSSPSPIDRKRGAWLGSMTLWANAMRLVPQEGIAVAELERQARTEKLQLPGLERWGYIAVAPNPADTRSKPPRRDWLVRATENGRRAQEVWRPLAGEIEQRWRERFGAEQIDALRDALSAVLGRIDMALPEYLPILGYGLFSQVSLEDSRTWAPHGRHALARMNLSALLSKTLLAFATEFEFDWKISLPVSANALRLLGEEGVRVANLPRLSGVAKEGIAFATGWLARHGYATLDADANSGRGKTIRLNARGLQAKQACAERLAFVEGRWRERFGAPQIAALREALSELLQTKDGEQPMLAQGLMPYPDGWRARKPYVTQTLAFVDDPVGSLPHFPVVLHRGGYPDGS